MRILHFLLVSPVRCPPSSGTVEGGYARFSAIQAIALGASFADRGHDSAEIEGSCDEVQPVAETTFSYGFQRLNYSDQLNPIFYLINNFSKCVLYEAFDR